MSVSTQRVWETTFCAHVYQKVLWRLISCSRPCLFCLKIPHTFLLSKRKLPKTFGVSFEYKLPRGFTIHPKTIFDDSSTYFDIFQRATRLPPPLYVSCSLLQNTTWPPNERNWSCCWFLKFVGYFIGVCLQERDQIDNKNQTREIETTHTVRRRCWKQTK